MRYTITIDDHDYEGTRIQLEKHETTNQTVQLTDHLCKIKNWWLSSYGHCPEECAVQTLKVLLESAVSLRNHGYPYIECTIEGASVVAE